MRAMLYRKQSDVVQKHGAQGPLHTTYEPDPPLSPPARAAVR